MDADFSIELCKEDPVLDFPWKDPTGRLAYVDLKRQPDLIAQVEEARKFPELGEFLGMVNSARSVVESAKCDTWTATDLTPEEDIYDASQKFASYIDLVFSHSDERWSFEQHERFAERWTELLRRAPELSTSAEICVRRCFFGEEANVRDGFYFTVYINGYGNDEEDARKNWSIGTKLAATAILQLSASPG